MRVIVIFDVRGANSTEAYFAVSRLFASVSLPERVRLECIRQDSRVLPSGRIQPLPEVLTLLRAIAVPTSDATHYMEWAVSEARTLLQQFGIPYEVSAL